nr:hypothetical protein [Tanacetum cinerariifolium]
MLGIITCFYKVASRWKVHSFTKKDVVEVFIEYWLTSVDHHYLSPFKPRVEIEELDDDLELNAYVVGSSKRLALEYGHKNVNVEESVRKSKKG